MKLNRDLDSVHLHQEDVSLFRKNTS